VGCSVRRAPFKAGFNFYAYVGSNPVVRTDPSGLIHQAWNEPPFDGRLHDDPGAGLEVLCTNARTRERDIGWLEHSIFVRGVEIDALCKDADAGHIDRLDAEIATLKRCHECEKKPDVEFEMPREWNTDPKPAAGAAAAAAAAATLLEEYGWAVVFGF
jgi:hypothetical protein